MIKYTLIFLSLLAFSSCAPKYQEGNMLIGGYASTQLGDRAFQITYRPGLFLNEKDLSKKDFVILRRAAEVTLAKGFTHFTHTVNTLTNGLMIHLYNKSDEDLPSQAINAHELLTYNAE